MNVDVYRSDEWVDDENGVFVLRILFFYFFSFFLLQCFMLGQRLFPFASMAASKGERKRVNKITEIHKHFHYRPQKALPFFVYHHFHFNALHYKYKSKKVCFFSLSLSFCANPLNVWQGFLFLWFFYTGIHSNQPTFTLKFNGRWPMEIFFRQLHCDITLNLHAPIGKMEFSLQTENVGQILPKYWILIKNRSFKRRNSSDK